MGQLEKLAAFFQQTIGSVTAADIKFSWLVIAFGIILLILIFTLEKSKAILTLLVLYALGFIALQIPMATEWLKTVLNKQQLRYTTIGLGAIPIIVLLVVKFKKKRR